MPSGQGSKCHRAEALFKDGLKVSEISFHWNPILGGLGRSRVIGQLSFGWIRAREIGGRFGVGGGGLDVHGPRMASSLWSAPAIVSGPLLVSRMIGTVRHRFPDHFHEFLDGAAEFDGLSAELLRTGCVGLRDAVDLADGLVYLADARALFFRGQGDFGDEFVHAASFGENLVQPFGDLEADLIAALAFLD